MSPHDVIPLPGHPGMHARRVIVEAWQEAGSPPVNSALRLYDEQKWFFDMWQAGVPGFNPADNPDELWRALGHVRGVALDITPTPERVRRLEAAGLERPFPWESWHWAVPNVHRYALVHIIPATAGAVAPSRKKRTMATLYRTRDKKPTYALAGDSPCTEANWLQTGDPGLAVAWAKVHGDSISLDADTWNLYKTLYQTPTKG